MENARIDVMIHACPARMWYVEEFLIPELKRQGADSIRVWNDTEKRGNLAACMDCFASMDGTGETWHIQDDVLLRRDFVEICRNLPSGVAYGFCCSAFGDNPDETGTVYAQSAWNSFQCVKIPNPYARECSEWVRSNEWQKTGNSELFILRELNKGDDTFFHEFMIEKHGCESVLNVKPSLVEHVDWIIGGSVLHQWRGFLARADYWEDQSMIAELKQAIKERR